MLMLSFFNPPLYYSPNQPYHKNEREVMEYELDRLRKSDVVIVNFNIPKSIGTAMEVAVARENRIPIIGNDFYSHNLEIVGNIFDNKTNNLRIRNKSCDDYISKEQALKMFEKHSYPVRYDGNSIEQGMTITGIRQVLNELTLVENTPQKVKGVLSELEIYCPNCGGINIYEITHDDKFVEYPYCPDCGQKLDWSGVK